ncbi:hypothetical protein J6590_029664 [Homalodisca vitripennis]|nr:hypothetical protein J6590_029664 [Homalodisca vitripennis]
MSTSVACRRVLQSRYPSSIKHKPSAASPWSAPSFTTTPAPAPASRRVSEKWVSISERRGPHRRTDRLTRRVTRGPQIVSTTTSSRGSGVRGGGKIKES